MAEGEHWFWLGPADAGVGGASNRIVTLSLVLAHTPLEIVH
jgi:hypothetical protein